MENETIDFNNVVEAFQSLVTDFPQQMAGFGISIDAYIGKPGTFVFSITREGEPEWDFDTPQEMRAFLLGLEQGFFKN